MSEQDIKNRIVETLLNDRVTGSNKTSIDTLLNYAVRDSEQGQARQLLKDEMLPKSEGSIQQVGRGGSGERPTGRHRGGYPIRPQERRGRTVEVEARIHRRLRARGVGGIVAETRLQIGREKEALVLRAHASESRRWGGGSSIRYRHR